MKSCLLEVVKFVFLLFCALAWFICLGDTLSWLTRSRPEPFLVSGWLEVPYCCCGLLFLFLHVLHKTME